VCSLGNEFTPFPKEKTVEYTEAAQMVKETLERNPTPQECDAALERFVSLVSFRADVSSEYSPVISSMSLFLGILWRMDRLDWIKRLNEIAVGFIRRLKDAEEIAIREQLIFASYTLDMTLLVVDFAMNAPFNLNPADFHLTPEVFPYTSLRDPLSVFARERIKHGAFESINDLQKFKLVYELRNLCSIKGDSFGIEEVNIRREQLIQLGADVSEFINAEDKTLEGKLVRLEKMVLGTPDILPPN